MISVLEELKTKLIILRGLLKNEIEILEMNNIRID